MTEPKILLTGEDFIPFQLLKSSACYTKKWVLFQVRVDHLACILKGKLCAKDIKYCVIIYSLELFKIYTLFLASL